MFFVAWIVSAIYSKFLAYHETRSFIQNQAQNLADNLVGVLSQQNFESVVLPAQPTQILLGWRGESLVMQQGNILLPRPVKQEEYVKKIDGINWVINTQCFSGNCVLVALRDLERRYIVRRIVAFIFLPLLLILSFAMYAIHFAIRSGLQPLNKLANTVSETPVEDLKPFPKDVHASEIQPLVNALNQFMTNIKKQLTKERQFLDTCAHELRTPVSGLVSQIQSVDSSQWEKLPNIEIAANRTVRVANQFLSFAKAVNAEALAAGAESAENFDLCELVRHLISDMLSAHTCVDCEMNGVNVLPVKADSFAVEAICRNLIENAIRYGYSTERERTMMLVSIEQVGDQTLLTVEDAGKGVEPVYWENLMERFYRVPQSSVEAKELSASTQEGAGLGLSIVNAIAKRYGGSVTIGVSENLGGLKVIVKLRGINQ